MYEVYGQENLCIEDVIEEEKMRFLETFNFKVKQGGVMIRF